MEVGHRHLPGACACFWFPCGFKVTGAHTRFRRVGTRPQKPPNVSRALRSLWVALRLVAPLPPAQAFFNPQKLTLFAYPKKKEWGTFPMTERTSPLTSLTYDEYKNNVSAEIIHGRFAMLGVTGAWAQENLVGTPWFMAGEECTFDNCSISYLNNKFEASYDGALLGIIFLEIVLMGGAEGYRTGLLENPFDDVVAGSVYPAGRFDPLNFSEGKAANLFKEDLDTLKIKELKHCRLAMLAWLGILAQSVSTNPDGAGPNAVGPVANWSAHVADVVHCNVVDRSGCVF